MNTQPRPGALTLLKSLLKPYKGPLAGALLAIVLSAVMMLAMGWGMKEIVDLGLGDGQGHFLNKSLLILIGLVAVMAGASYARLRLVYAVAERITADLRRRVFTHLLSLDPAFYDDRKSADLISRINADTSVLQVVITSNLPTVLRHALMMAGGLVMLCVVSPSMTGLVVLAVPLIILPIAYFGRRVRAKSRETQARVGDAGAYGQETLQGIQTVQSFGYEMQAGEKFGQMAEEVFKTAMRYVQARAVMTATVIFMVLGAIFMVLWYGGHRVIEGGMTGGDLAAFIFYATTVAGALMAMSEASGEFNRARGAADRIIELLLAMPQLKGGNRKLPAGIVGDIAFENVSFSYPSRPGYRALDGISFDIPAGRVTAIVGPSGAGKSTVFQLLQRFYDPAAGAITIGGLDLSGFDPREVRRLFGTVSQDPVVFSMSVADNIRIGRDGATDAEVEQAAKQAQAHEFIMALPQGYATVVGERGNRLSGGQRQRLAIARAILKNPKILLLDEATSALDAANEKAVHAALKTLMQGRTTLVIAHRLATVQGADQILVLDKGRLVGQGTHADLYGREALYTHLAGLQMDLAS